MIKELIISSAFTVPAKKFADTDPAALSTKGTKITESIMFAKQGWR